jgi:uncharacterized SAM-binding protein YcdF (DUF218 family)
MFACLATPSSRRLLDRVIRRPLARSQGASDLSVTAIGCTMQVTSFLYVASKVTWRIVQPENLLILLLAAGVALLFTRWNRLGFGLVALSGVLASSLAFLPVGRWLLAPLENRFPRLVDMPAHVDGVIMLGGMEGPRLPGAHYAKAESYPQGFVVFADLARCYPNARLVFAGGGTLSEGSKFREADAARETLNSMGLDTRRIIFERESRDTLENVVNARTIARPAPGEIWILVTPAFHAPRSVGLFRGQGWEVIADPVDFQTRTGYGDGERSIDFLTNLGQTSVALKEWIGMLANCWLGYSKTCFPSPDAKH